MKKNTVLFLLATLAMYQAEAHVTLNNPSGGETFSPGETVTVEWQMTVAHNLQNWDLYFSSNGGGTWVAIKMDIPPTSFEPGTVMTFAWLVPPTQTFQGQIRIVQDNDKTDYEGISGNFTIESLTSTNEAFAPGAITVYPNPVTDRTTFEFDNPGHESHNLLFYDMQGRLVKTITDIVADKVGMNGAELPAGLYSYQLISKKGIRATGKLAVVK